ncbi:MAG: aminodeoxychorismate/anthranilate synthase component II [Phycisphaerae bacterium]|nr:aminodeoxychorismate/anthranilate synthase component II [Phycisphaerae bacterium]
MILLIDNYDSFTYNLAQDLMGLKLEVKVVRNDKITLDEIKEMAPEVIVISPGPGRPENAGVSLEVVKKLSGTIPILGVCLGHQTIGQAFGGKIVRAPKVMHGKVSVIEADGKGVFEGIKSTRVMRYHSLVIEEESLPDVLEISARSDDGMIMGIRHKEHMTEGVQFHPESIMSPMGKKMVRNFIDKARQMA